jgi:hypothetical protein
LINAPLAVWRASSLEALHSPAVLLLGSKVCYHTLWSKKVIPLIGILYDEAAKLGCLAAFYCDRWGWPLLAGWGQLAKAPLPKLLGIKSRDRMG